MWSLRCSAERSTSPRLVAPRLGDPQQTGLNEAGRGAALAEVRAAEERLPDGVRKTVIGQPPLPVNATTASM